MILVLITAAFASGPPPGLGWFGRTPTVPSAVASQGDDDDDGRGDDDDDDDDSSPPAETGVVDTGSEPLDTGPGIDPEDTGLETTTDDADADGFGRDEDCDDADPDRFPGAAEVPDDGIDQDCSGADASSLVGGVAGYECGCRAAGSQGAWPGLGLLRVVSRRR